METATDKPTEAKAPPASLAAAVINWLIALAIIGTAVTGVYWYMNHSMLTTTVALNREVSLDAATVAAHGVTIRVHLFPDPDHGGGYDAEPMLCDRFQCTQLTFEDWRSGQRVEFRVSMLNGYDIPVGLSAFDAARCRALARATFFKGYFSSPQPGRDGTPSPEGGCYVTLP